MANILIEVLMAIPFLIFYPPIRDYQDSNPKVQDIQSHLQRTERGDEHTVIHEGTHQINSDLRGKYNRPCFYLMNNLVVALDKDPDFKLSDVDIPLRDRGQWYGLYMIQSRKWWNDHPTYLLDELVAYSNDNSNVSTLKELIVYCSAMGILYYDNEFLKGVLVMIMDRHSDLRIVIRDTRFREQLNLYYGKEYFIKG